MRLETIKRRINEMLEHQTENDGPPSAVILLPFNARCPASEEAGPFPRVQRIGRTAIVTYLGEQPTRDELVQLLAVQS